MVRDESHIDDFGCLLTLVLLVGGGTGLYHSVFHYQEEKKQKNVKEIDEQSSSGVGKLPETHPFDPTEQKDKTNKKAIAVQKWIIEKVFKEKSQ